MQASDLLSAAIDEQAGFNFDSAKKRLSQLVEQCPNTPQALEAQSRIPGLDALIKEKQVYERIDENAKRVLTDIGMNIASSPELVEILMEADAIDFESTAAVSMPLKRDYIDQCLERVNRTLAMDPGPNAFGTGATPPFLKVPGEDRLRSATKDEFQKIVNAVGDNQDVVKIFSLPVATDKSITAFEAAQMMEKGFQGLKMTAGKGFSDSEMDFFKGKDDWLDGTSLITTFTPMDSMVTPFIRSAQSGGNLLLLDLSIAGSAAAGSPEALLTQIHAQVMFMMVVAQTITPGINCVHGGIPGVDEAGGDLSYSSKTQPLINAAMARLNRWVTGFPSAQSGGSTSRSDLTETAVVESARSRDTIRRYGAHIVRHAMGTLGSLNYFCLEKFLQDCDAEKQSHKAFESDLQNRWVTPLFFPEDKETIEGLREIAEKGNPKYADHTLKNVNSFMEWEHKIDVYNTLHPLTELRRFSQQPTPAI